MPLKNRPGDQPLPHGSGPVMHDLVSEDIVREYGSGPPTELILADLEARKQLGIERYKEPLMAHNGRDALLDLYQELLDASVYAMQGLREVELPEDRERHSLLSEVYDDVVRSVFRLRGLMS